MNKLSLTNVIWGIILPLLLFSYYHHFYSAVIESSAGNMLVFTFGGLISFHNFEIMQILAFVLIFTAHLMSLGNELFSDYGTVSVYIFTRGKTRRQWLLRSFMSIFIKSIIFYIILFATVVCCAAAMRYSFDLLYIMCAIYYLMLTLALMNTLLVIIVNILCVVYKYSIVYTIALFLYCGWIAALSLLQNSTLTPLVPISRSLLLLHKLPSIFDKTKAIANIELNFSICSTLLTGIIIIIITYGCSMLWFKNFDIMRENQK